MWLKQMQNAPQTQKAGCQIREGQEAVGPGKCKGRSFLGQFKIILCKIHGGNNIP